LYSASQDRPAFLRTLKQLGVVKLTERQALANAIGKGVRSGWVSSEGALTDVIGEGRLVPLAAA